MLRVRVSFFIREVYVGTIGLSGSIGSPWISYILTGAMGGATASLGHTMEGDGCRDTFKFPFPKLRRQS